MMKKMTKKNEKNGYFIQKIVKKLQPRQTEDDGEIFADISDENDDTVCLYSKKNNKIILFCTHTIGYFIYKHHMVGLVLKVNPQLYCCYQPQSIKHTHRKIVSKMFLLFRKKRKHAKAFTSKNGHITKKVLGYSVLSMITYATLSSKVRDKSVQNPVSQFPAVLHTVSLLSKNCFRT